MTRWQPLDEKMSVQHYCDDAVSDVESQQQSNQVHSVSISIPACLAWHVLSFCLGILTTMLLVWGFMACAGAVTYIVLGP
jgi:hypothetical protein